jgi:hypothetical protein
MNRSIFGWDYPPGVSSLPWDVNYPCEVCGGFEDDCICPECPECGSVGDPECYKSHGLVRTSEQVKQLTEKEAEWKAQHDAEIAYYEKEVVYED